MLHHHHLLPLPLPLQLRLLLDIDYEIMKQNDCIRCSVEMERIDEIDKLNLTKYYNNIYDYESGCYTKSKWIIPDNIEGKIPGFILLKCTGDITMFDDVNGSIFTHCLEFAYVRPEYRKQGILKNMINQIPKEWNIWLEASSKETENVENIWEKCGFRYHETIHGTRVIYKKLSVLKY
jgi:GNAT superfamily N-acetyltransferase